MLKPQDIVVVCKLVALQGAEWTIAELATSLSISGSEVHAALARAADAGLYLAGARSPSHAALFEFLAHGVRYAFAARRQAVTRGILTGHGAPVLESSLAKAAAQAPVVWPAPNGDARGEGLAPLYRTAPQAALNDPNLYRLLALVDAERIGTARERKVATEMLQAELL